MSDKRKEQKTQTKEKIIAAGFKVYSERGFTAPTNAVAHAAGVSHGSVFAHFPTVEDLLVCLLNRFSADIENELQLLSGYSHDISELLNMHINVLIKYEEFYTRLIKEAVYLPEEARNTFIAIQSTVSIHFKQALFKQMEAGKVKDIPFHMIFNTWLSLVHYYLINSDLFAPSESVLKRHKDSLIECFLALIKN